MGDKITVTDSDAGLPLTGPAPITAIYISHFIKNSDCDKEQLSHIASKMWHS